MHKIDLKQFAARGRITQREAEEVHTILLQLQGITDGDAVIAEWNRRSPESLWGEDGESPHIHSFTDMLLAYMQYKTKGEG